MSGEYLINFLFLFASVSILSTAAINLDTKYTEEEMEKLKELKEDVQDWLKADYQKLDFYLMHFLRRKDMDLNNTKMMLNETLKWRKDAKIEGILKEKQMLKMEQNFPYTMDGFDKDGRPILTYIIHKWNIRRHVLAGKAASLRRYQIYIIEKVTQLVYKLALEGNDVSQFNILIDLSGFNMKEHACLPCMQGLNDIVPLLESKYTNMGNQLIFVNAPRAFESIVKLLKDLLPSSQRDKLYMFGYDKTEWRAHLNQFIEDDQIPSTFGGNKTSNGVK